MALSIHPKSKSFTPMWTVLGLHKVFAKKVLHKAVHAALSDSKQNMGKPHSKDTQTATEIDYDGLRIDLIHLPDLNHHSLRTSALITIALLWLCEGGFCSPHGVKKQSNCCVPIAISEPIYIT